ncbi:MAG: hypothetical protein ACRDUV_05210 [Pseudonocardiaceae bacterium]
MSDPHQLAADVLVGSEVPAEHEPAIIEAFRAVGVAARVRMVPTRRGVEELPWLVLATLPLQAFLTGLGVVIAEDVTQRMKRLVGRVLRARRAHPPAAQLLVLQDADTRLQVVLESDLPPEAYQSLPALDLSQFRHGPLRYDRQLARWRSELDEANRS